MGIAAQVAARSVDWPSLSWVSPPTGPSYPITFPIVPLGIKAELLLGGAWVDITSYIYYEDKIRIERGRGNESARATPSKCTIKLKNPNRIWSPRNANGAYYGLLNRNVKLRISINPGDGDHLRYTGYVSQWPQQWTTGNHRWVSIQANGILKRLGMGKSALRTPIYRAVTAQSPYAFWTLTDPSDATAGASEIVGGSSFTTDGDFAFGGFTAPDGTPSVDVNGGFASAPVTPVQPESSEGFIFGFGMKVVGSPADAFIAFPYLQFTTTGWHTTWTVLPQLYDGIIPMQVDFQDTFNTSSGLVNMTPNYATEQAVNEQFDNIWHYYQIVVKRVGINTDVRCYYDGEFQGGIAVPTSGLVAVGNVVEVRLNPQLRDWTDLNLSFSNISVIPLNAVNSDSDAFFAYAGESPTARFARVCTEEGIDYSIAELIADTEPMGPQPVDTLLNILRECEAANEGVMDEDFQGRLRLISRTATWNQPPAMIVNYAAEPRGQVKEGFRPTDDDLLIRNDWTITRKNGGSRRYVQETGPLNVQDPTEDPQGVLRYDDSATLNLYADDQCYQHATWRVSRGTVDEMRIAELPLHFSSTPELIDEWLTMDINSAFKIVNTPLDMGGIPAFEIMTGYVETFDRLEWRVSLFGAPASAEQMGIVEQYGYLDCSACTLAEDLDTTETGIDVAIADTCTWVSVSLPFNVEFSGEEVTVTAVSVPVGAGSSWTQTLTVTRSVNGVVKTHSVGAEVHVTEPFIPAL